MGLLICWEWALPGPEQLLSQPPRRRWRSRPLSWLDSFVLLPIWLSITWSGEKGLRSAWCPGNCNVLFSLWEDSRLPMAGSKWPDTHRRPLWCCLFTHQK